MKISAFLELHFSEERQPTHKMVCHMVISAKETSKSKKRHKKCKKIGTPATILNGVVNVCLTKEGL